MIAEPEPNLFLLEGDFDYDFNIHPHPNAIKIKIVNVDVRYTDAPEKVPYYEGASDWWYNEGTNHRLINGLIARDVGTVDRWAVRLNSLDELMSLVEYFGRLISLRKNSAGWNEILTESY